MTTLLRRALGGRAAPLLLALALALLAAPAAAQEMRGVVVRDGQPLPGVSVALHRVTRGQSGEVGKGTTAADGAFRFRLPPAPDSAGFVVYFATAQVAGVRYFGPPLHAGDAGNDYRVVAYDTTSSPAAVDSVRIVRRDVALVPDPQGGWEVGEILRIENRARRTVVPDGGKPVWGFTIPAEATSFEVGEGSVAANEVVQVRSRVLLSTPLVPGTRDVFVRYRIPRDLREMAVPVREATDTLNLFVREPAPPVEVEGLRETGRFTAEGDSFRQFTAAGLRSGARVSIAWEGPSVPPVDPRIAAVALTAAVLAAGAWAALRRRPPAPAAAAGEA